MNSISTALPAAARPRRRKSAPAEAPAPTLSPAPTLLPAPLPVPLSAPLPAPLPELMPATAPTPADECVLLRAMLESVGKGLVGFDRQLRLRAFNRRLTEILNVPAGAMHGERTLARLLEASAALSPAQASQVHQACRDLVEGRLDAANQAFASACGTRLLTLSLCQAADELWMGAFKDVTATRVAEAQALEQALSDPLTGLAGRPRFHERLDAAFGDKRSAGRGHAVMLIDLDRFKAVNDTLGHPVGDALLRKVAVRLRESVRSDDLIARLGGDEFAVLLSPALPQDKLAARGRRIVSALGRPFMIDGHTVSIGASVGIAVSPADGQDPQTLIRNADLALYAAKTAGRGTCAFFDRAMDARAAARRRLEVDLRRAIALREFELHYQPQVDLETCTLFGFEALLRWRHPERGLVPPSDFIPLAEEIGLIGVIGAWAIRAACLDAVRWPDEIGVAVNVSAVQFKDGPRLLGTIAKALEQSGLPGRRLEVEITEGVLLQYKDAVIEVLQALRAMGVRVAMDDFGTGYSTLSQLQSFPFDKIKIDRSFIRESHDPAAQGAIIRAITALGSSLGMSTIAEGVETSGQLERIRAQGCTSVQGYLFSRPVPSDRVRDVITELAARRAGLEVKAAL